MRITKDKFHATLLYDVSNRTRYLRFIMLNGMCFKGPLLSAGLFFLVACSAIAANVPACDAQAKAWLPCELHFDAPKAQLELAYTQDVLNVEFRSPTHSTHLMYAYNDGSQKLAVRFTPTEPGAWTYHLTSSIAQLNDQEGTFSVASSDLPGFISVANLRHWRTANKQPHLWMSAALPFLSVDQGAYESWLDARKHDGFTHVRGTLLSTAAGIAPLLNGKPNPAYFAQLDERILAASRRGFVLDLIVVDGKTASSPMFGAYDTRAPLLRYLVSRYGALNVTWQGIEEFEDVPRARQLLRQMYDDIKKVDSFNHPRSTDARDTSWSLVGDGWMNYIVEAYPQPALAAVEHQFTSEPEVHVIRTSAPADAFRHELWNATANAEYICAESETLKNPANLKALQIWHEAIVDTRHWEFEPYFDVDGARAAGLPEVEFLAYAQTPGIVEVTLTRHKYNPFWLNPITGEQIPLKDYRGEVLSRETPDKSHDWVLQIPREGHKESMLKSYRFESVDPPIQEPELDPSKTPYQLVDPPGDALNPSIPIIFGVKLTKHNRATREMQYVWYGEVVAGGEGARILGTGSEGTFNMPKLVFQPGTVMNLRVLGINANGKAYEVDRVYNLQ